MRSCLWKTFLISIPLAVLALLLVFAWNTYVSSSAGPVAPTHAEAGINEETTTDAATTWVCDGDLLGNALVNKDAETLMVEPPPGYEHVIYSSDASVANGQVIGKGHLGLGDTIIEVETVNTRGTGLGWNEENERWNIHACAIPGDVGVITTMLDWQYGNRDGENDRAGENKPQGWFFTENEVVNIWEEREPSIDVEVILEQLVP